MSRRKKTSVSIVFFSGTGCTKKVAETFKNQLEDLGFPVFLTALKKGYQYREKDFLILCFPVHAANAPGPVMEWARLCPTERYIPTAVLSVSGGGSVTPNLACRTPLIRLLRKKGYHIIYEGMLTMPSNWIYPTEEHIASLLLKRLPFKTAFIINALLEGRNRRMGAGFGNRLITFLGRLESVGAKFFGRGILVGETCTGCGICQETCSVGNISMKDHRPVFGGECVLCLGCIYACPVHALTPKSLQFPVLSEGFDLKKIRTSPPDWDTADIRSHTKGLLWLGVRRSLLQDDLLSPEKLKERQGNQDDE